MARREYLRPDERSRFDMPPGLTPQQRPIFLDLPAWAKRFLAQTLTPTNQVGFLLQLAGAPVRLLPRGESLLCRRPIPSSRYRLVEQTAYD